MPPSRGKTIGEQKTKAASWEYEPEETAIGSGVSRPNAVAWETMTHTSTTHPADLDGPADTNDSISSSGSIDSRGSNDSIGSQASDNSAEASSRTGSQKSTGRIPDRHSATPTTPSNRTTHHRSRATVRLWLADQPGAWAMALLPAIAGVALAGGTTRAWWLLAAWTLCYCVQFTASHWLKSRFAKRYFPPIATYGIALAAVGVPFVAVHPDIVVWAPLYLALAVLIAVASWTHRERSLWGNAVAVAAASAMPMVMVPGKAGMTAAVIFALQQYGSVLFVKTMIRERGNAGYLAASWVWNVALLPLGGVLGAVLIDGPASIWLAAGGAVMAARAIALPLVGRRRRLKPLVPGMTEFVTSFVTLGVVLVVA